MGFKLGIREVEIKEFLPKEIGVHDIENKNIKIIVKQEYLHVFFIPIFGLKKHWYLKNGKSISLLPNKYIQKAKNAKVKTPWYIFIGPMLMIFGIIISVSYVYFGEFIENKKMDDSFVEEKNMIKHPKINDYYSMLISDSMDICLFKVVDVSLDSIQFKVPYFKNEMEFRNNYGNLENTKFIDTLNQSKVVWVSKNLLFEAYRNSPNDWITFKGIKIPQLYFFSVSRLAIFNINRTQE